LTQALSDHGFVQVSTPIIMAKGLLAKMTIDDDHPLTAQIYWLSKNQCLRPMLAPNLYYILKDLLRLWEKPVSIFEVGPCFRKETQGAKHASEFTMLNLTEFGLPVEACPQRLKELAQIMAEAAGLDNYDLEIEKSEVYGETLDVVAGDDRIEVGSGAMGPHPLDRAFIKQLQRKFRANINHDVIHRTWNIRDTRIAGQSHNFLILGVYRINRREFSPLQRMHHHFRKCHPAI